MNPPSPRQRPVLVIGYGNTLRGDDAAGQRVAAAVADWGLAEVRALAVPQLTPELAELVAAARLVVFVDVCLMPPDTPVTVVSLETAGATEVPGHTGDPRALLALAQALYGRHPPAWWVLVPGVDFALREGLSRMAAAGVAAALYRISHLLSQDVEPD